MELQYHSPAGLGRVELLNRTARKMGLPAVASHGIYYQELEQASLQRTITAIRLNRPIRQLNEADTAPPYANFLSPAELSEHFSAYPEALENTLEIADRCQVELPLGVPRFPQLDLPEGAKPIQVLRQKAQQGLIRRFDADPTVQSRLDHELDVIQKCGYEALFLVMEDIVGFARQNGIPIASRGSASSSLVAHCLGITTPNPVRLNLYFERFLNPAAAHTPGYRYRPLLKKAGRGDPIRLQTFWLRTGCDGLHGEPFPTPLSAARSGKSPWIAIGAGERAGQQPAAEVVRVS